MNKIKLSERCACKYTYAEFVYVKKPMMKIGKIAATKKNQRIYNE